MTIELMQNELDYQTIEEGARVYVAENLEGDVISGALIGIANEDFVNNSDRIVEITTGTGEVVAVYAFTVEKIGAWQKTKCVLYLNQGRNTRGTR